MVTVPSWITLITSNVYFRFLLRFSLISCSQLPIHPVLSLLTVPPVAYFFTGLGLSILSSSSSGFLFVFVSGSPSALDCGYILAALLCIFLLQTKTQSFQELKLILISLFVPLNPSRWYKFNARTLYMG